MMRKKSTMPPAAILAMENLRMGLADLAGRVDCEI